MHRTNMVVRFTYLISVAALLAAAIINYRYGWNASDFIAAAGTVTVLAIIVLGAAGLARTTAKSALRLELADSRAILAASEVKDEGDLKGLRIANTAQMEAYDELVRSQGAAAFRASVAAMGIALLVVLGGFAFALWTGDPATKYAAAIITASATATGGFIARTFINVQQSTQEQMRYYFKQPLVQSYLLTAERLATQLPKDDQSEQYKSLITAAIAQAMNVNVLTHDRNERIKLPPPRRKRSVRATSRASTQKA